MSSPCGTSRDPAGKEDRFTFRLAFILDSWRKAENGLKSERPDAHRAHYASAGRLGVSPVVATAILASVTLFLGVLLMTLGAGWFSVSATELNQQANREIQLIRSSGLLVFEMVRYAADPNNRNATVRNVSELELCVTRIELIREDGSLSGSWPRPPTRWLRCDPPDLRPLRPRQNLTLSGRDQTLPGCPNCRAGERVKLRVWYVPRSLYDRNNPENSADEMRFVETLIVFPGNRTVGRCTLNLGNRFVVLSSIDPITYNFNGSFLRPPNDRLFLGFSHPTPPPQTGQPFPFKVGLYGRENIRTLYGDLRIDLPYEQPLSGAHGMSTPFLAEVSGHEYRPVPWMFYFDRTADGLLHVSDIRLFTQYHAYLSEYPILTSVQVTLGKLDGVSVSRKVYLSLYDCNDVALVKREIMISAGPEEEWITVFIDITEVIEVTELAKVEVLLG